MSPSQGFTIPLEFSSFSRRPSLFFSFSFPHPEFDALFNGCWVLEIGMVQRLSFARSGIPPFTVEGSFPPSWELAMNKSPAFFFW